MSGLSVGTGLSLGGLGGGTGSGSIAEDMYFADIAARDAFTTAKPERLYQGVACAVVNGANYDYYQWDKTAGQWRDANLIYQGRKGDKGDDATLPANVMLKSEYDVDDSGSVDRAQKVADRVILGEPMGAGRLVAFTDTPLVGGLATVYEADKDATFRRPAFAITVEAGNQGDIVRTVEMGLVDYNTAQWRPGTVLYLGAFGNLTDTATDYRQQIAIVKEQGVNGQIHMYPGGFNLNQPAPTPIANEQRFKGVYETTAELQTDFPNPASGSQAVVLEPAHTYYHVVNGAWVAWVTLDDHHDNYLGLFAAYDALPTGHQIGSLALLEDGDFYVQSNTVWTRVEFADVVDLDRRVASLETRTQNLESQVHGLSPQSYGIYYGYTSGVPIPSEVLNDGIHETVSTLSGHSLSWTRAGTDEKRLYIWVPSAAGVVNSVLIQGQEFPRVWDEYPLAVNGVEGVVYLSPFTVTDTVTVGAIETLSASFTPEPISTPVSDESGHLNLGWTPMLEQLYPYSGVVSEIGHGHIFFFDKVPGFANKVGIGFGSEVHLKVMGKYVVVPKQTLILPEAELNLSHDICYDDLFIDDSGVLYSERSYNLHKDGNSFNTDAIAQEHGFVPVPFNEGVFSKDGKYHLLMGRIKRRNKRAYHDVVNPEGTAFWWDEAGHEAQVSEAGAVSWVSDRMNHQVYDINHTHSLDKRSTAANTSGSILGTQSVRPDGRFHDAIGSDDFIPLYKSAKRVTDTSQMLNAVMGELEQGGSYFVADNNIPFNTLYVKAHVIHNNLSYITTDSLLDFKAIGKAGVWFRFGGELFRTELGTNDDAILVTRFNYLNGLFENGDFSAALANIDYETVTVLCVEYPRELDILTGNDFDKKKPMSRSFMAVDVFGHPVAMPDLWHYDGVPGRRVMQDRHGNSLLPDGTEKDLQLTRKCIECYRVLKTSDFGENWTDVTSQFKYFAQGQNNSLGVVSMAVNEVIVVYYETTANPFEWTDVYPALSVIDTHVWMSSNHKFYEGGSMVSHLIGKVPVGDKYTRVPLTSISYTATDGLSTLDSQKPAHWQFGIGFNAPAAKLLPMIDVNGNLHIIYKELNTDSIAPGDTGHIEPVVDRRVVKDLNGHDVEVGHVLVRLPYHFGKFEV